MQLKPLRSHLRLVGIAIGVVVTLVAFQNCSDQDFSNTLSSGSTVTASDMSKIPFAFDFQANQLSYMSCSRSSTQSDTLQFSSTNHLNDPNVFYTFKVGAYDDAGLGLRKEFIDYVTNTFAKKGILSDAAITDAISNGTAHNATDLQFAIRQTTPIDTQILSVEANEEPTLGISYSVFPEAIILNLKEFFPQMISLFRNPAQRLTYLGGSSLQQYRFEAALHYEQYSRYNEASAEQVRNQLNTQTGAISRLLTITYTLPLGGGLAVPYHARKFPSTVAENRVWGTGFKATFASDPRMQWKQNILETLQEYDLTTFEKTRDWSCPASFRYIIVAPKDRATYPCRDVDPSKLNDVQKRDLMKMRRHLSSAKWIIDPDHQCVSPRNPADDCYGNSAFRSIDYKGEDPQNGRCGISATGQYLTKDCAEFVSFCFR